MTAVSLRDVLCAESGTAGDVLISGLSSDSTWLEPGWAFAACAGGRHHGLAFIADALRRLPAVILWEPAPGFDPTPALLACAGAGVLALEVPDLRRRLGELAARVWGDPSARGLHVHGVTGTDGKTSVSQFLAQALEQDGGCGVIGTLGHGRPGRCQPLAHTTPDAPRLQGLLAGFRGQGLRHAAMEVSSHALDQGRVDAIVFHTAILTNLGHDHLDYHGSQAAYAAAKRRLFMMPGLSLAVLNRDSPFSQAVREVLATNVRVVDYGWQAPGDAAHGVWCVDYCADQRGCDMTLSTAVGRWPLRLPLLGRFNVENVMAVAAVLVGLGWSASRIGDALGGLQPIPGRMEPFRSAGQPLVVVDYAHTPGALEAALASLRPHVGGRLYCVFGCGGERDRGKRPLMGAVAARGADRVIVTDDNPRSEQPQRIIDEILAGLEGTAARVIRDRRTAIAETISEAGPDDAILVAGKGHEDYRIDAQGRTPYSDRDTVAHLLGCGRA
jgi:UDP-N-acetylmuramoyl-L-alanyl-D-glutamate--2,6-diaminopimelate ligase